MNTFLKLPRSKGTPSSTPWLPPKPLYIHLIVPSNSVPNRGQEIEKPEFNTYKGPEVTTDCEHLGITNKEGARALKSRIWS